MKLHRAALMLLLSSGLHGCSGGSEQGPGDEPLAGDENAVVAMPPMVRSLDDLAPGDTLGILELMRTLISEGNSIAGRLERRDTTMPSDGHRERRTLSLWSQGDLPVKLVATEPNEDGLMRLETITWFTAGDIAVVQEPFAVMMFDADRLVLWSDEAMVPVDAPYADQMAKERSVVDSVRARLRVFGVIYP